MVRGVMMCNVWGKVAVARALIRKGERMTTENYAASFAKETQPNSLRDRSLMLRTLVSGNDR